MTLSNLTLGYEFLADDPIETSIHYGESILQFMSDRVQSAAQSFMSAPKPFAAPKTNQIEKQFIASYSRPVAARLPQRPSLAQSYQPVVRRSETPVSRSSVSTVSRFNLKPRTLETRQRAFVGVI